MDFALLVSLGLVAGWLTTIAGVGGGVLLILALSLRMNPAEALALTAPALLIGNLHRLALSRREVELPVAVPFILGALPGSVVGGLLAVAMPVIVLQALLVISTGLALARAFGWLELHPPRAALVPAGAMLGAIAATTGSAGLAVGALLQSVGLTGGRYIATVAASAVAMHLGRIAAYGAGGLVTRATIVLSAVLAVAILAGNLIGGYTRKKLPPAAGARLELGVLVVCVVLALVGLA